MARIGTTKLVITVYIVNIGKWRDFPHIATCIYLLATSIIFD